MKSISHFSIKKPLVSSLIIVIMVLSGIAGLKAMKMQLLPNFDIPVAMVNVTWTGASPEDVDKLITKKIEDALKQVDDIDEIDSSSSLGVSSTVIQFRYGTDVDERVRDIQSEIDNIKNELPDDINDPIISKMDIGDMPVIIYNVYGTDLTSLYKVADEEIKPMLERIKGVSEVDITGGLEEEVRVEFDPTKLAAYSLSITDIKTALASSNSNIPAGNLREADKEFLVKVDGEIDSVDQIKNTVISNKDGKIVRISDIGVVKITSKDVDSFARQNGKTALRVEIKKSRDGNTIEIIDAAKKAMAEFKDKKHGLVDFIVSNDNSISINNSISSVEHTAVEGIILTTIVLFVFLKNMRATTIVSVSLPVSVMFTFALLYLKGVSINMLSLMGLTLGIGLLVDNSIVVVDNIYRRFTELKEDKVTAAGNGAAEMAIPILTSTLTIVAVFLPVVLKAGMAKEIFHDLSYAISFSLLASLVVSLVFVPMAAAKFLNPNAMTEHDGKIFAKVKSIYLKVLTKALQYRGRTLLVVLLLFILSMLVGCPRVKTEFMPDMDTGQYVITGTLAKGLDVNKANEIAKQIENVVKKDKFTNDYSASVTADTITVNVQISGKKERKEDMSEVISEVRSHLQGIPDVKLTIVNSDGGPGGGSGGSINLKLYGSDTTQLKLLAEKVTKQLKNTEGLADISSSNEGGNPELVINVDREKAQSYGLKISDITSLISYQVKGGEAFTIKSNSSDVDVTVRLAEEYRNSSDRILDLYINTSSGPIKLKEVATLTVQEGAAKIDKEDGQNVITISGNPDGIDLNTATAKMKQAVEGAGLPSGITYDFGGNQKQFTDVMKDLLIALATSIILMYLILTIEFNSLMQPLIILTALPLSIIGVLFAIGITGIKFNVMVMIGIIMLGGIVVNNGIVFIDFVNVLRAKGMGVTDALKEAAKTRLRPIIMTKATAEFGMVPMALALGEGSEYYQGLAIAVIFGLTFSTLLTLFVIPVLYSLKESAQTRIVNKFKNRPKKITTEE